VHEAAIWSPRITLIIPTLDEEDSIGSVISAIPRELVGHIIVADGGSRDATVPRARAAGAEVLEPGRGYGRACMAGALAAHGSDILVFTDGDGADDPSAVAQLAKLIADGECDFAIGSRVRGNRAPGSIAWHQLAAGWLGMRELTYGWNIEMQMRAAAARLRIVEIPVDYHCRIGGRSKVAGNLLGSIKAATRIIATFARVAVQTRRSRRSDAA